MPVERTPVNLLLNSFLKNRLEGLKPFDKKISNIGKSEEGHDCCFKIRNMHHLSSHLLRIQVL